MKGTWTDRIASLIATLVWVKAAGLMIRMLMPVWGICWMRSIRTSSALLWRVSSLWPACFAVCVSWSLMVVKVMLP